MRPTPSTLALLALLACTGDPASVDTDVPVDTDAPDTDVPDTDVPADPGCAAVQQSLDHRCVVCHGAVSPQAGLDLRQVDAVVGRSSTQSGLELIAPFAPQDSYLFRKVTDTHAAVGLGTAMPPPGLAAMDAGEITQLSEWIEEGANCEGDTDTDADTDSDTDTDTDADADTDSDTDTDPVVDPLCAEAQAVFDANCVVCHGAVNPFGNLDLRDAAALVDVTATGAPMAVFDSSGSLADSYAWHKMRDTQVSVGGDGTAMPPPPISLPPAGLATVEAWLQAGAGCEGDTDTDTDSDSDSDTDTDTDSDVDTDTDADTDPVEPDGCAEVQSVLDTNCTGCHGVFAIDGLDLRNVLDVVGIASGSSPSVLIAPGDAAGSYLIDKIEGTHLTAGGQGVQMPPGYALDPADLAVLTAWIDAGATCAVDPGPPPAGVVDPNELDPDSLFVCDGQPTSSPARLRRIDKLEFRRRIGQSMSHPTNANPFETPGALRFSTYSEDVSLDIASLDLYFDVLSYAGSQWVGAATYNRGQYVPRTDTSLNCMYAAGLPSASCVENWVATYLETAVAYEIPPQDEVDRLTAFAEGVLADEIANAGSRSTSITQITSAAWLHTRALFASEMGEGTPDAFGRVRLSDSEATKMLADMISDRGPGASGVYLYDNDLTGNDRYTELAGGHLADLAAAGQNGSIQQPLVAGALLRQYAMGLDDQRKDEWIDVGTHSLTQRHRRAEEWMSDKIDRFFLEFFDVERFESGFHDTPNATTRFEADSVTRHQRSLDELRSYEGYSEPDGLMGFTDSIAKVVVGDQDVLRNLLTTTEFYLPATTDVANDYSNRIFNLTDPVVATREGRWNTLPETERAGMLTHPVWLAAHGDAFEDGPSVIHRGKWVREHLLCESIPPLELVTVEAQLLPSDGTLRARDRVEQSIEVHNECMACHQRMNSLGYAFEIYNHAGYLREDDHGFAPDGSTTIDNAPDPALNLTYTSAIDMMDAFADSEHVKRCFIRQTFRFFAGRDETPEDACVLTEMEQAYDTSGGSFVSLLETLATHDTLMYRTNDVGVAP